MGITNKKFLSTTIAIFAVAVLLGTAFNNYASAQCVNSIDQSGIVINGTQVHVNAFKNGFSITYIKDGQSTNIRVLEPHLGVMLYSINNGQWNIINITAMTTSIMTSMYKTDSIYKQTMVSPDSTNFLWDGINFVSGYPYIYPHPNVMYYQIYTTSNTYLEGNQLVHYQLGSNYVSTIGVAGPFGVGAAIGAILGLIIGGLAGAAIGAILGGIIGAVLAYFQNAIFADEAGAIWWWANLGFWHALNNIPWWVWLNGILYGYGYVATWLWSQVTYFRVGNHTFINDIGLSDP